MKFQNFKRWPFFGHLGIATVAFALVAILGQWFLEQQNRNLNKLSKDLTNISQQLELGKASNVEAIPRNFSSQLSGTEIEDDFLHDVAAFAQTAGVQIFVLTPIRSQNSPSDLGKLQLTINAKADYSASKAWLSRLLDRYSGLAVRSLSMRVGTNDNSRQDIAVVLVLHTQF